MRLKIIVITETLTAKLAGVRRAAGLSDDDGPPLERIALCDELIQEQEAANVVRLPQRAGIRIKNFSFPSRRRTR